MSTASTFTRRVHPADIPEPAKSAAAHLAAKLQLFQTDERTLTDELCDMLCIWLGMAPLRAPGAAGPLRSFSLTLSKTTTFEEVRNGADLELVVSSPLGFKRCLIQAKVLDPSKRKLRCDSKLGWQKLRKQLVNARNEVGDLAFLLVYVPGAMLNGEYYGYDTYEQLGHFPAAGAHPAYYGATIIPVDDLLGPSGRWRNPKLKVPQTAPGAFKGGIAFWRFLMEILLCRRSSWSADAQIATKRRLPALRSLSIGVGEISRRDWRRIQEAASEFLPPDEVADEGNNEP